MYRRTYKYIYILCVVATGVDVCGPALELGQKQVLLFAVSCGLVRIATAAWQFPVPVFPVAQTVWSRFVSECRFLSCWVSAGAKRLRAERVSAQARFGV